jgi:hypothetical protein
LQEGKQIKRGSRIDKVVCNVVRVEVKEYGKDHAHQGTAQPASLSTRERRRGKGRQELPRHGW